MRAVPITVTALAAALLLTACGGGDDSASDDTKSTAPTDSAVAGSACDLAAELGPVNAAPAAGDSGNVTVTLTNKGSDCTLDGFPTVELEADGTKVAVPADAAAAPQKLALPAQGTTSFTITYVRGEDGGEKSLAAKTVKYGLPGASATESFEWSYGAVSLKDEKTPDASVSGFQQAGD